MADGGSLATVSRSSIRSESSASVNYGPEKEDEAEEISKKTKVPEDINEGTDHQGKAQPAVVTTVPKRRGKGRWFLVSFNPSLS